MKRELQQLTSDKSIHNSTSARFPRAGSTKRYNSDDEIEETPGVEDAVNQIYDVKREGSQDPLGKDERSETVDDANEENAQSVTDPRKENTMLREEIAAYRNSSTLR